MSETKEVIQIRMLANMPDTFDKSEGSFFHDATKPVAIELETAYADQANILNKGFIDTATGTYLDLKVAEQGLVRKPAVKATTTVSITGTEGTVINIRDLVASDTVNYATTESKTIGVSGTVDILVECETAGSIGNVPIGAIKYFPVTIQGLTTVTNVSIVNNGYDGETDSELRTRYYEKVQTPATSGNKYHYRNWAKEVTGIGDARVFPLWNGAGTVKIVIIDSNKTGAETELITSASTYIEDVRPIGATVTVESAIELPINLSATLTIDLANYTLAQVKTAIETNVANYLKEIAFVESYLSYAKVGSLTLSTPGVLDYASLTVNSGISNITIADAEVAVLGVVTVV